MVIVKVKHLPLSYGHLPTATASGVKIRKPADIRLAMQNKQNRPDTGVIDTGATQCDENPGNPSQLPPNLRAGCFNGELPWKWCQQHQVDSIDALTWEQCQAMGIWIANHRGRAGYTDDGAVAFATSQMGEGGAPDRFLIKRDMKSLEIERWIAITLHAKGYIYGGGYDGALIYEALRTDKVGVPDLSDDQAILAWLRKNSTGNMAFTPYTANGQSWRGQAVHLDVLFQSYFQAYSRSHEFVALVSFAMRVLRAGLRGLAFEKDPQGNFYHTAEQRAQILSRRVINFTWNVASQVGTQPIVNSVAVAGGVLKGFAFMPCSWPVMVAATACSLIDEKTVFHWDDTNRYGENPAVLPPNERILDNTLEVGYFSTGNSPVTIIRAGQISQYEPNTVNVGYPLQGKGDADTCYAALDLVERARDWIGDDQALTDVPVQCPGESAVCPTYTRETYPLIRSRALKGWGYRGSNSAGTRRVFIYTNFHVAPYATEDVTADLGGGVTLQFNGLSGSNIHVFLVQV